MSSCPLLLLPRVALLALLELEGQSEGFLFRVLGLVGRRLSRRRSRTGVGASLGSQFALGSRYGDRGGPAGVGASLEVAEANASVRFARSTGVSSASLA